MDGVVGAVVGFYPYPFIDVTDLGYGRASVNCVWVSLLLLGFAGGAVVVDRLLSGGRSSRPNPTATPLAR